MTFRIGPKSLTGSIEFGPERANVVMPNTIRPTVSTALKDALSILEADSHGWWAIHTSM